MEVQRYALKILNPIWRSLPNFQAPKISSQSNPVRQMTSLIYVWTQDTGRRKENEEEILQSV